MTDRDTLRGVLEYDADEHWLVETDDGGASTIVARDVTEKDAVAIMGLWNVARYRSRTALAQPAETGLDVERLARAYAQAGYGPVLTEDEWADIAAEYARLGAELEANDE